MLVCLKQVSLLEKDNLLFTTSDLTLKKESTTSVAIHQIFKTVKRFFNQILSQDLPHHQNIKKEKKQKDYTSEELIPFSFLNSYLTGYYQINQDYLPKSIWYDVPLTPPEV